MVAAIAIYAVGASDSFRQPPPTNAVALREAGRFLLVALLVLLCATFAFVAVRARRSPPPSALLWSIVASLILLAVRLVYSTVAAFKLHDIALNPLTGRIVYQIVLEFLPGALIIAVMVAGGLMTTQVELPKFGAVSMRDMPANPIKSTV